MIKIYPLNSFAVLSTSTYINWEGIKILTDIGPGTVTKLVENHIPTVSLGVLISHSHIDHFWDLVPLLWLRYLRNQKQVIKIICPKSDIPLIEWCNKVSQNKNRIEILGMNTNEEIHLGRLIIKSFSADHKTSKQPLSYIITEEPQNRLPTERLTKEGVPKVEWRKLIQKDPTKNLSKSGNTYQIQRKIVYSGDSRSTDELKKNSINADLLIIESTYISKDTTTNLSEQEHMSIYEALELASEAYVKNVLLTHFSMKYSHKAFLKAIRKFTETRNCTPKIFYDNKSFEI